MSSFPAVSLLVVKCDLKPAVEAEFNCHSKNTIVRKFYSIHAPNSLTQCDWSPHRPFSIHFACMKRENASQYLFYDTSRVHPEKRKADGAVRIRFSGPYLCIHTYKLVTLSQGHMKACNSFHVTRISHMTYVAFEGNGIYYCISKNYSEKVIILAISFTMVIFIYSILITHKVNIFKHFWSLLIAQEN